MKTTKTAPTKPQRATGRRIRLRTAKDCSRFIARAIKRTMEDRGESEVNLAYKQVCMATMLVKAIETSDIEERLHRMEKLQNSKESEALNE